MESLADLEKRYAEMSDEEFGRLRRQDLIPAARPCYDREARRRGLSPPPRQQISRPDPADILRKVTKKHILVLLKMVFVGGLLISVVVYFGGPSPVSTFLILLVLFLISSPARGDRIILWLRRFHVKKGGLHFDRLLSGACGGFGYPVTVQDTTFRRSDLMATSILNLFFPLVIASAYLIVIFLVTRLGRSEQVMSLSLILFFLPCVVAYVFLYMKLSYTPLDEANACKRTLRMIRNVETRSGWHTAGVFVIRCQDSFWREIIGLCLASTAVALIDVTEPSENVVWELETAVRLVGPECIVLAYGVEEGAPNEIPFQLWEQLTSRLGANSLANAQTFFYPVSRKQLRKAGWRTRGLLTRELKTKLASGIANAQYRDAIKFAKDNEWSV